MDIGTDLRTVDLPLENFAIEAFCVALNRLNIEEILPPNVSKIIKTTFLGRTKIDGQKWYQMLAINIIKNRTSAETQGKLFVTYVTLSYFPEVRS